MPRVLTVGATGYLGQAVTLSLVRRGGHVFYGLARSEANARSLAQLDIIPVLCSDLVNYPAPLLRAIETERISVVVACGADQEAPKLLAATVQAGKRRLEAFRSAGQVTCPKLGSVYTSGIWVHGSSTGLVGDLEPTGSKLSANPPAALVAWRPALEQEILNNKDVCGSMRDGSAVVHSNIDSLHRFVVGAVPRPDPGRWPIREL